MIDGLLLDCDRNLHRYLWWQSSLRKAETDGSSDLSIAVIQDWTPLLASPSVAAPRDSRISSFNLTSTNQNRILRTVTAQMPVDHSRLLLVCRAQDSLTEIPLFQLSFVSPLFDAAARPIPVEDHFKSWIIVARFLCAVCRITDDGSPHFWLKILLSIVVALQSSSNRSDVCNSCCAARPRTDCP